MTTRPHFADIATVALSVLAAVAGLLIFFAGPADPLPIHWGADGQADDWGNRQMVGGLIFGLGMMAMLIGGGMGLAAGRATERARARALRVSQAIVLVTFTLVGAFFGTASLSRATALDGALSMAAPSLLFLVVGALLGRVGANPFVGVRTPWAYKSRLAWERSNRLAGRLFFLIGLVGLAASPVAPQPLGHGLLIGAVMTAVVWSVFESWRVWRTDPERQPF